VLLSLSPNAQSLSKLLNLELNEDGALIVVDLQMRILPKSTREQKMDFLASGDGLSIQY
jgi:hypothetical protein